MIVSFRKCFFINSFLLAFIFSAAIKTGAQTSVLNRNISITAVNQPLYEVLSKIGRQSGIKFSYNPDDVAARRLITITAASEPLNKILRQILDNPSLSFREMGNQVIIYKQGTIPSALTETTPSGQEPPRIKAESPKPLTNQSSRTGSPDTLKQKPSIVHDTVIIKKTDTLVKKETILVRDTVHKTDTVFIEKPAPLRKESPALKKNNNHSPYSIEISYTQYFGKATYKDTGESEPSLIDKIRNSESASLQNFSVGPILNYDVKKMGFSGGILYSQSGEKFDYEYLEQWGGFYRHDTVETYYSISGIDTSWFYVTDSTWINAETKKFTFSNSNSFRYLEIPLSARYYLITNRKFSFYIRGGLATGILLGSNAIVLNSENGQPVRVSEGDLKPLILSWTAGAGIYFRINESLYITAEALYRRQFTPLFSVYPADKKYQLPGLKAGMCIKL